MRAALRCRQLANALNLSTAAGLLLAALSRTPVEPGPDGLLFGTEYRPKLPLAGAFTVGNVIFYRADRAFIDSRPDLLKHEAAHSTQYAWCLGLPFLPLYAACAAYSWWRTGDPGSRNFFERSAGLALGGYRELPTLTRLPALRNSLRSFTLSQVTGTTPRRKGPTHE
ncbi:hypothetical protein QO003_003955 [Arthrobacter silviterrae]|uniref:hypothetical protein n=1 Tax=Arthrobacter TaxID=1663 RepID=UPI0021CD4B5F|nr:MULTISPECIES: hypothetical protein [Arthrobacter]MCU6479485.1 hypothetical protein [Arthrobacter sp. A2-55]MDQ0279652.1 hypothetical protein [Arthrobacter silviterrae]